MEFFNEEKVNSKCRVALIDQEVSTMSGSNPQASSPERSSKQEEPMPPSPRKPKKSVHKLRTQGIYFDPKNRDPLSSRLVHRFMFAEFLGSLFANLIAQGAVISCGVLTYQMNYDELTPGRILCIAFATGFVS